MMIRVRLLGLLMALIWLGMMALPAVQGESGFINGFVQSQLAHTADQFVHLLSLSENKLFLLHWLGRIDLLFALLYMMFFLRFLEQFGPSKGARRWWLPALIIGAGICDWLETGAQLRLGDILVSHLEMAGTGQQWLDLLFWSSRLKWILLVLFLVLQPGDCWRRGPLGYAFAGGSALALFCLVAILSGWATGINLLAALTGALYLLLLMGSWCWQPLASPLSWKSSS